MNLATVVVTAFLALAVLADVSGGSDGSGGISNVPATDDGYFTHTLDYRASSGMAIYRTEVTNVDGATGLCTHLRQQQHTQDGWLTVNHARSCADPAPGATRMKTRLRLPIHFPTPHRYRIVGKATGYPATTQHLR